MFSQDYVEPACRRTCDLARLLIRLFEARFDPSFSGDRAEYAEAIVGRSPARSTTWPASTTTASCAPTSP